MGFHYPLIRGYRLRPWDEAHQTRHRHLTENRVVKACKAACQPLGHRGPGRGTLKPS